MGRWGCESANVSGAVLPNDLPSFTRERHFFTPKGPTFLPFFLICFFDLKTLVKYFNFFFDLKTLGKKNLSQDTFRSALELPLLLISRIFFENERFENFE